VAKRRWEFDLDDGHHVVEFEHGYFRGKRKFVVDGVPYSEPGRPFMDHSGQYPVRLEGHRAAVWISTNGFTYRYDLVVEGRSVTSGGEPTRPRPPVGTPRQNQIVGLVFVAIGIVLVGFSYRAAWDEYQLHTASATAAATVDAKSTGSTRSGTIYYLSYTFVDPAGAFWHGRDSVSRQTYDTARPGTKYVVVYVRADPSVNRFAGGDNTLGAAGLAAGATATLVAGLYLRWRGGRRMRLLRRIAEVWQPINGTVTKVNRSYVRGVGQTVTVQYEYDDPFGIRRKGRGPLMYPQEGETYKVGAPVRILIDPDRPKDSVLP